MSGTDSLKRRAIQSPALESFLLLSKASALQNRQELYTRAEKEIVPEIVEAYFELIERRLKREPSAYIVGYKEFYSRRFRVKPGVLIPRPETELLADEALKTLSSIQSPQVLDLGTGSGCLAVTFAKECPEALIVASDISKYALKTASENARDHSVLDKITFIEGDALNPFSEYAFDMIVSNPPYIPEGELGSLEPEVRDYEPMDSLAAGPDGLDVIRKIAADAPGVLKDGGSCLIEVGIRQSEMVMDLFYKRGFSEIRSKLDINGIERVVEAKWKK